MNPWDNHHTRKPTKKRPSGEKQAALVDGDESTFPGRQFHSIFERVKTRTDGSGFYARNRPGNIHRIFSTSSPQLRQCREVRGNPAFARACAAPMDGFNCLGTICIDRESRYLHESGYGQQSTDHPHTTMKCKGIKGIEINARKSKSVPNGRIRRQGIPGVALGFVENERTRERAQSPFYRIRGRRREFSAGSVLLLVVIIVASICSFCCPYRTSTTLYY